MNSLRMSVLSNKAILCWTASLALLAGCAEKPSEEMLVQFPVSASAEVGLTKVSVQGDYSLVWNQGDRAAFLAVDPEGSSAGTTLTVYAVDSGFGRAMFKGSVTMSRTPQTCFFAYPESSLLSADGSVVFSCASQTGAHSPFLTGSSPYDASGMEVLLKQAGGMLHLHTPEGVVSVAVRGNASEPVSKFCVRDASVSFPSDALEEFTVPLSGTDNYIAMPPVNFSRGFSLVFTREDGARMFKSYSSDGGQNSGFDFSAGKFVEINVQEFVQTSVSATVAVSHVNDGSGILTGSSVTVSSFSCSGITSKIVSACGIELYVGSSLARKIEASSFAGGEVLESVTGWPYLPSSSPVTLKPYCVVNGEKVYGAQTPVTVPAPSFTASVSGYTSYSLYRKGDVSGANSFTDATAIKAVGASVGISADILSNPNYAAPTVSFATDKGKSLAVAPMRGASYTFGEWGGHPWDTSNLTATVTFDGVAVSSAPLPCVVTGLPYSVDFNSQPSEWSRSSNTSWTSGLKLGGNTGSATAKLDASRIYVPDGESVDLTMRLSDITMRTISAMWISNPSILEVTLGSSSSQLLKGPDFSSFKLATKDEYHSSVSLDGTLSSADKGVVLAQTRGEEGCYCTIGGLTLKYR